MAYGLSRKGCTLFELVSAIKGVEVDDFLLEITEPLLLEVPSEGGKGETRPFEALLGEPAPPIMMTSTVKVPLSELLNVKRSKDVQKARIYLLEPTEEGVPVTIGRAEEADVMLPAVGVSRMHAEIHKATGQWLIEDLDSNNGTFVDGERIAAAEKIVLKDRQRLWLADFRAILLFPERAFDLAKRLEKS